MSVRSMVLGTTCVLAFPGAASASTVGVAPESQFPGPWAGIVYEAAAGETNHVELFTVDDRTIRVTDPSATIQPLDGCTSIDPHTAVCSVGDRGLIAADVRVGDLDDVVVSHGPGLSANGGPGHDRLESSGVAAGTLNGGEGRDVLLGGTNLDTLIDGDRSGSADADILDGREGGAIVSYAGRTAPVYVDLSDVEPDGEQGEGDVLRSVDRVIGGSGDDVLRSAEEFDGLAGGPGDDRLYGGPGPGLLDGGDGKDRLISGGGDATLTGGAGPDLLLGGLGDDTLDGGAGADRLRAGAGNDRLSAGIAFCGPGQDQVWPSRERDHVRPDCETAGFAMKPPPNADFKQIEVEPNPYRRTPDAMWFRGSCPFIELDGYPSGLPIRGAVTVRRAAGGEIMGRGRIPVRAARRCAAASPDGVWPLPSFRVRVEVDERLRSGRVMVSYTGRHVPPRSWTIALSAGVR